MFAAAALNLADVDFRPDTKKTLRGGRASQGDIRGESAQLFTADF